MTNHAIICRMLSALARRSVGFFSIDVHLSRKCPCMTKKCKGRLTEQTELTPLQKRFCMQVAILTSTSAAARLVGISERTARRWLNLPLVEAYIDELHEQSFATAMQILENATLSAVLMLNEAMNSEHTDK